MNSIDPEVAPMLAEKVMRDAQWRQMAEGPEQPPLAPATEPSTAAPTDRLTELQTVLAAKEAELAKWKKDYGERENKLGEERKRVAERLARLEAGQGGNGGYQPTPTYAAQPVNASYYDPRILEGMDPNGSLTASQTAALMWNMAQALGTQLSTRDQQLIETARVMRDYDLTPSQEADLMERHTWLATLHRTAQISAMKDLTKPQATPGAQPKPQGVDMAELARARIRSTQFIETSSRGSAQETQAVAGIDSDLAKKAARLKQVLNTPGGAEEAEKLIGELQGRRR
jgi:hypothetical protein